jgi:hypothetical protein
VSTKDFAVIQFVAVEMPFVNRAEAIECAHVLVGRGRELGCSFGCTVGAGEIGVRKPRRLERNYIPQGGFRWPLVELDVPGSGRLAGRAFAYCTRGYAGDILDSRRYNKRARRCLGSISQLAAGLPGAGTIAETASARPKGSTP